MSHSTASQAEKNPRAGNDFVSPTPTPNSSNYPLDTTPLSSFHKCVCLEEWWLVKAESDWNGKRLAVGGLTSRLNQAKRVFQSSPIVKRNDAYTLETTDGITVIIQGLINRARSSENGFPPEVCSKFLIGFPLNWEVYSDQYLGKESVSNRTSSSCLDEFSTVLADIENSDPPSCFDELPISKVLDCLISTHGGSDSDMVRGTEIHGNCSASASRNCTSWKDVGMRNIIPFLMDARLLEEIPIKHKMFNSDWKCVDTSEGNTSGRSSRDIEKDVPEESRKTILSKESENLNEVLQGNYFIEKSKNPSINASKHCSMQTARRFISPCKVGKNVHKETPNEHEMAITSDLFNISESANTEENQNCLNDRKIGCKDVQGEFFPKVSDLSNLKGGTSVDKKPESSLLSGSTKFQLICVSGDFAPNTVRLVSENLCDHNNSVTANVDLEVIDLESTSIDTSDVLCNVSEEMKMKNCTYSDVNRPTSQTVNNEKTAPPVMGSDMQKETQTLDACGATRASTSLKNLKRNQKEKQTSDHNLNNENVLSSSSMNHVSQNDGSICDLNAGSVSNVSNLGFPDVEKDLIVRERDDGCLVHDKEPGDGILTGKLSKGKTGCGTSVTSEPLQTRDDNIGASVGMRRSSRRLKKDKNNLEPTGNVGIANNEVSAGNSAVTKRNRGIAKNEVSPRKYAKRVFPELREKLISTETNDRRLECGQESKNESLKRELFTDNAAVKGKVQAGSGVETVIASEENVETSERFLCKRGHPRKHAKGVFPELREKLISTEKDDQHLECGQESKNESLKRELFRGNAAMKGKVQAGSDAETVIASEEKVETSERLLCKPGRPRRYAKRVFPELKEKLISTETDGRHLECGQESKNESLKRELFTGNAAMKGKVEAGSNVETVIPSAEKVESPERFLCKSDPKTTCSRLKHSKNKQDQDQTKKEWLQTEKRKELMSTKTMNIEHKLSGESASGLAKVALENKMLESPPEKIANGHHECGLDCLSCQHGVDSNVQKGSNVSDKILESNDKAEGSSQKKATKPEFTSFKGSNLSVTMQKSNDKAKRSSQKSNVIKQFAYQSVTRNRAQKLSLVSPESLNFKRSRSGRLLVPPLANWRNQQIIYDPDGVIAGITLGYDGTLPASGNKQGRVSAVQQKLKPRYRHPPRDKGTRSSCLDK